LASIIRHPFIPGILEGGYRGNGLVLPITVRKVDRRGHEDCQTVGVIELEMVTINEADGGMRTKQRNREHFQEVTTDLEGQLDLVFDFWFGRRATLILLPSLNTGITLSI